MSHLQECQLFLEPMLPAQDWCICQQLRACEQRVLDAAREAIAGLPVAISSYYPDDSLRDVGFWKSSALAAIDALKVKS